jgi:hypothetical protein
MSCPKVVYSIKTSLALVAAGPEGCRRSGAYFITYLVDGVAFIPPGANLPLALTCKEC